MSKKNKIQSTISILLGIICLAAAPISFGFLANYSITDRLDVDGMVRKEFVLMQVVPLIIITIIQILLLSLIIKKLISTFKGNLYFGNMRSTSFFVTFFSSKILGIILLVLFYIFGFTSIWLLFKTSKAGVFAYGKFNSGKLISVFSIVSILCAIVFLNKSRYIFKGSFAPNKNNEKKSLIKNSVKNEGEKSLSNNGVNKTKTVKKIGKNGEEITYKFSSNSNSSVGEFDGEFKKMKEEFSKDFKDEFSIYSESSDDPVQKIKDVKKLYQDGTITRDQMKKIIEEIIEDDK